MHLRIGLLNLPELLAEVVRSAFEPGDAAFEKLPDAAAVAARGQPNRPVLDAVIVGVQGAWERSVLAMASDHPRLVVIGLRRDGRTTWLYELVPHPRELGELGPAELRATVLATVHAFAT